MKKLKISEWAEANLHLPKTSAEPGKIKLSRTPYARDIMDAFTDENIHKVVVKSAAQIGKSTILLAVIGYFVQNDPTTIMIVQPTLETAQDFSKDRLNRMIQDCPALTPLFEDEGKTRNPNQTILSKYFTGGRIVLVGANSPSGLASKPIRVLLCDEVDRFPVSAGAEGDAVALAEKRQTTFWNRKTGLFSTPTVEGESRIDAAYIEGTMEEWQHSCPNCGEYHFLDYKDMVNVNGIVKWRCPDCGNEFSQAVMADAPQKFIAQNISNNTVRSFWINGFSSPWLKWNDILSEYEQAKGNPARESVVFNTRFGISYQLKGEFEDENLFLNRREVYDNEVPEGVKILTCGVDVQNNRLEYLISGFGNDEECWAIARGVVFGSPNDKRTWDDLDKIIDRGYQSAGGILNVARTFIDSGYNTNVVYEYCKRQALRGRFAIKGKGGPGIKLIHTQNVVKNAGILLITLGVDDGKTEIFSRLGTDKGAGFIHFGVDDGYLQRNFDSVFFKQLLAEKRVVRKSGGVIYSGYENVNRERNEALDVFVYCLAAMKSLNINWDMQRQEVKPVAVNKKVVHRQVNIWS